MSESTLLTNNIKTFDELGEYKLEHYIDCFNDSSNEIKSCRGLIYKNNVLLCKSFPFTSEYLFNEDVVENKLHECLINKGIFFPSYEGSIVRVWNDEDKWFVSTHKKIDASKSRWGSNKTFKDLFIENLFPNSTQKEEDFINFCNTKLLKDIIYIYLIKTTLDNRIVCRNEENKLYYLGNFNRNDNFQYDYDSNFECENVSILPKLNILSYEDFRLKIEENERDINNYNETQGILCLSPNGDNIKFVNPLYYKYNLVRGNSPNILYRYIELKKQLDFETIDNLRELYKEENDLINDFENSLRHIKLNILRNYIKRYINKSLAVVPPEQHRILVDLYNQYLNDPQNNRLTIDLVSNYVDSLALQYQYNLFKQYQKRRTLFGNGNWVNKELKDKSLNAYYKEETKLSINNDINTNMMEVSD